MLLNFSINLNAQNVDGMTHFCPILSIFLGEGFSLQKHYEALSFQVGKLPHKRYRKKGHLASSQVEKVFLYGF